MATIIPAVNSKDGTRIAYDKVGHGPAVILVLGAMNTRKSEAELAELVSSHFTVITYDRRGRGDSTNNLPYSIEREIEDIEALINEAGGSALLYGHSSGGALVLEAAIRLGKKIKKIAIYEAPYNSSADARRANKDYNEQLAKFLKAGNNGDAVALFMRIMGVPDEQVQGMRHAPTWKTMEQMAPTLAYDSAVLGADGAVPSERLADISVPTLVMSGRDSPAWFHDTAGALSKAIPGSSLRVLEKQTHHVRPEVLAPVLAAFFSGTGR